MRGYIQFSVLLVALITTIGVGCATGGDVADDDDFGGGPLLPPALAEWPTPGDGASQYAMHCARCHQERWPTERTDAQWKTIKLHMRGISNMPGEDADAILAYLRSSN